MSTLATLAVIGGVLAAIVVVSALASNLGATEPQAGAPTGLFDADDDTARQVALETAQNG